MDISFPYLENMILLVNINFNYRAYLCSFATLCRVFSVAAIDASYAE